MEGRIALPKRASLFSQGEVGDCLYYIERGYIAQTITTADAKTAVVGVLSENSFVGEDALSGAPHTTGATALLPSSVLRLSRTTVLREVRRPESALGDALLRYLIQRNSESCRDMAELKLHDSQSRLARLLYLLARLNRVPREFGVAPRLSQEELSQIVGTTRPRIGLFLKRFRSAGHVQLVRGGLLVRRSIEQEVCDPDWTIPSGPQPAPLITFPGGSRAHRAAPAAAFADKRFAAGVEK